MRARSGCGFALTLALALCMALAAGAAHAAGDTTGPPARNEALETPPPLSASHATESLGPVTVEGNRIARPSVHDVFEQNLHRDQTPHFRTVDLGNGHRCTSVQPFGYEQCTDGPALFVFRVG